MRIKALSAPRVALYLFVLLLASVFLARVLSSPSVEDLARLEEGAVSPRGDWILVCGKLRSDARKRLGFLLRDAPRKTLSLGSEPEEGWLLDGFAFSNDGSRAAWVHHHRIPWSATTYEVVVVKLDDADPQPIQLPVSFATAPKVALSPDGSRAATLEDELLSVIDVTSQGPIESIRIPKVWREPRRVVFLGNELLRLYPIQRPPSSPVSLVHRILELELKTHQLTLTGSVQSDSPGMYLRPDDRGDRIITLEHERSRVTLRDGKTGTLVATLRSGGKLRAAEFLSGGRVAVVWRDGDAALVRLYTKSGEEVRDIRLATAPGGVALMGEPAPQRLLVGLNPTGPFDSQGWILWLIDLSTGSVIARHSGLAPLYPMEFWQAPALRSSDGFHTTSWRVLLGKGGGLVDFNAMTGEVRVLLLSSQPPPRGAAEKPS